jgi:hypothetical protein
LYSLYFRHKSGYIIFSCNYVVKHLVSYFFHLSRKRRDLCIVSSTINLSPYLTEKATFPLHNTTQIRRSLCKLLCLYNFKIPDKSENFDEYFVRIIAVESMFFHE